MRPSQRNERANCALHRTRWGVLVAFDTSGRRVAELERSAACQTMKTTALKIAAVAVMVPSAYVGLYLVMFDLSSPAPSRLVEFTSSGKQAVVGPFPRSWARSICPPRGSGFLWSKDYTGNEWHYVMYRPLTAVWAEALKYELHPDPT